MMTSDVSPNANLIVVRCRQGLLGWFMVALFSVYCGFFLASPWLFSHSSQPPAEPTGVVFFAVGVLITLPTLAFAVYLLRAEIVADDTRLYIRGLRGYQSIGWDEVMDYYEKRLPKGQRAIVIVSPQKTWIWSEANWKNLSALRECVQLRAKRAFAHDWAERGERPEEPWPLVFDYNTSDNRVTPRILGTIGIILLVFYAWMFLDRASKFQSTYTEMGLGWALGTFFMSSLVMLSPVLMLCLCIPSVRETRRRRNQRIFVTREGLTFEEDDIRISIPWAEITEYFSLPRKGIQTVFCHVVVGKQGKFEFIHSIGEYTLLKRLIERYAPEVAARGRLKYPDEEDLLKSPLPASSGEQVYHYRSRSIRAMLWLLLAFALMPLLMLFLISLGLTAKQDTDDTTGFMVMAALLNGILLWAYWWYRATSVHTDAQGIMLYTPLRKRYISWGDVQEYYISGSEGYRVAHVLGSQTRIRFWLSILRSEALKAEISARATHSRSTKWEHRNK